MNKNIRDWIEDADAPDDENSGSWSSRQTLEELAGGVDDVTDLPATPEGVVKGWQHNPRLMLADIERHLKHSHGLTADTDLFKKIVNHLRGLLGPDDTDTTGS